MQIQWYPGHMAKARRLLIDQLGRVDIAIELCDARLPLSSRNPDLDTLLKGKKRLLILNKSDLAEEAGNRAWASLFQNDGLDTLCYVSTKSRAKDAIARVEAAAREAVARQAARGIQKTVRAMVVGVPNVGKSTFINRLRGGAIAKTGDRPGVTRANQWVKITPYLELLDTPGLLWPRLDDPRAAERLAYIGTIRDEIMDQEHLAIRLLEDLLALRLSATRERFKITEEGLSGPALLAAVCKGRGFLMGGGVCDTARGAAVVLDEFRAGKLGRMTLEWPEGRAEHAHRSTNTPHEDQ